MKTLEDKKHTLLNMKNSDWCMCKNGKPCIDSIFNINRKLEKAYNLGVAHALDRVSKELIGEDEEVIGLEPVAILTGGYCFNKQHQKIYKNGATYGKKQLRVAQRQSLSNIKQELLKEYDEKSRLS